MAAPTQCTVSGQLLKLDGTGLTGVTVKANCVRPFVHPTDSNLYEDYEVTTTTDSNGNWSLTLIETTTPAVSISISFFYPASSNDYKRKDYYVTIPNQSSVAFTSLISGQT